MGGEQNSDFREWKGKTEASLQGIAKSVDILFEKIEQLTFSTQRRNEIIDKRCMGHAKTLWTLDTDMKMNRKILWAVLVAMIAAFIAAIFTGCNTIPTSTSPSITTELREIKAGQVTLENKLTNIVNNALDPVRKDLEIAIATMEQKSTDRMWFGAGAVAMGMFFVGMFLKITEIKARLIVLILGLSLIAVGLLGYFFFLG